MTFSNVYANIRNSKRKPFTRFLKDSQLLLKRLWMIPYLEILQWKFCSTLDSMAKEKAPCHNEILMEFFQQLWPSLGNDFYRTILKNIQMGAFHKWVTRGLSLIPKEGDNKDLNHWLRIILLTIIYKISPKMLQLQLQAFWATSLVWNKTSFSSSS